MQDLKDKPSIAGSDIVAYFDFDGTLTKCDSLIPFVRISIGWVRFLLRLPLVLPTLILYLLRFINNEKAKTHFITIMLGGTSRASLEQMAQKFALGYLDKLIEPEVYARLEYHLEHGHTIILVSANLAIYLRYWAKRHEIDHVIATEVEFYNDKVTGKLATHNCYGVEKLSRVNEYLAANLLKFSYGYAYGNSRGDYELLDYANEGFWVNGSNIIPWNEYKNGTQIS